MKGSFLRQHEYSYSSLPFHAFRSLVARYLHEAIPELGVGSFGDAAVVIRTARLVSAFVCIGAETQFAIEAQVVVGVRIRVAKGIRVHLAQVQNDERIRRQVCGGEETALAYRWVCGRFAYGCDVDVGTWCGQAWKRGGESDPGVVVRRGSAGELFSQAGVLDRLGVHEITEKGDILRPILGENFFFQVVAI